MRLALRLARTAEGHTAPNPMVGAVLVKAGRIVGQGFHRRAGCPHAEVEALSKAGRRARGATLYVTLEPCNHHGRTPPCCHAIIASGISQVVAATRDPNPIIHGRGIARLRRAGVRVTTGVLEREAQQLNEPFFKTMRDGVPLVVAKIGQSLDGKIATTSGESRWITSLAARRFAHQQRRQVDVILVGINTVLRDDPLLTAPGEGGGRADRPIKVIVDSSLRTPLTARCLSSTSPAPSIVATTVDADGKRTLLEQRGVEVLAFRPQRGRVPLRALCQVLARRGIQSILIEGGGEVLASAFAERLVDRIVWFIAPILIGGRRAPSAMGGEGISRLAHAIKLADVKIRRVGPDLCIEARVVYPKGTAKSKSWAQRVRSSPAPALVRGGLGEFARPGVGERRAGGVRSDSPMLSIPHSRLRSSFH